MFFSTYSKEIKNTINRKYDKTKRVFELDHDRSEELLNKGYLYIDDKEFEDGVNVKILVYCETNPTLNKKNNYTYEDLYFINNKLCLISKKMDCEIKIKENK